ncbi:MAG: hypothetical protein IKU81_04085 [Oscillibacter sp.]|nr:hypothetical protein [Oscillibacter sp.]
MRKNRMMRAASALLVAVLMTTCTISGTFAKYVTSVESQDAARVAKWGFEPVAMDITGLFDKVYDAGAADYTVESAVDVIAPGTQGSAQFAFAYDEANGINAPEVDYTFKVDTTGSEIADSIKGNANIQWKLDGNDYTDWDTFIGQIQALDGDEDYEAGELPAAFGTADNTHTVYWRWIFTTGNASDVTDTTMGNADELANVKLCIKITATQID